MRYKYNQLFINLLKMSVIFFFSYCLISLMLILMLPNDAHVIIGIYFIVPYLASAVLRFLTKDIRLHLLFYLVMLGILLILLDSSSLRLIGGSFFVLLLLFNCLAYRNKNYDNENIYLVLFIMILLLNFSFSITGDKYIGSITAIFSMLTIVFYFIIDSLLNLKMFVETNRAKANISIDRLTRLHRTLLIGFLILCTIAFIIINHLPLPSSFKLNITMPTTSYEADEVHVDNAVDFESFASSGNFEWLAILLLFLASLIILYIIISYLRPYKKSKKKVTDKIEFIHFVSTEKTEKISTQKKHSYFKSKTNNEKIRHIYLQLVKKRLKHSIPITTTSKETLTQVSIQQISLTPTSTNENEINTYASIYDKARYSNEDCTSDEVAFVKHCNL